MGGVKVDKDKWIVTSSQLSTAVRYFIIYFMKRKIFLRNLKVFRNQCSQVSLLIVHMDCIENLLLILELGSIR